MRYVKFDDVSPEETNSDGDVIVQTDGGVDADSSGSVGDEVVSGIYVSDFDTVQQHADEIDRRFDVVVSVCQDACSFESAELVHIPIAETDGQQERLGGEKSFEQFATAADRIYSAIRTDANDVLVHCHAGVNRSVGTLSAALSRAGYADDVMAALEMIESVRPRAGPLSRTRGWMRAYDAGLTADDGEAVDAIVEELQLTRRNSSGRNSGGRYGGGVSRQSGGSGQSRDGRSERTMSAGWNRSSRTATRDELRQMDRLFSDSRESDTEPRPEQSLSEWASADESGSDGAQSAQEPVDGDAGANNSRLVEYGKRVGESWRDYLSLR